MTTIEDVWGDVEASANESGYAAVNTLWLALLKLANTQPGSTEKDRMVALVRQIPANEASEIVNLPAVDALLSLDPPLESVLASRYERNDPQGAQRAIDAIRVNRMSAPRTALLSLGPLLKRIRDKREHGFKTRHGPRDSVILGATRSILDTHRPAFRRPPGYPRRCPPGRG